MSETEHLEVELRRQLAENAERLSTVAPDDFPERHALASEADELRSRLQALAEPGLAEIADGWADRAGRKGSHGHDPEVAKGAIASPGHGPG